MRRILFVWELGANLGHLTRDLPLAQACRDAGYHVVMAVSDLRVAVNLLGRERFTLIQAPLLYSSINRTTPPVNYPDMLLHEGYDNVDSLGAALTGWDGLFELVRPSLVVYNHAPTALIAARTKNIPVMIIGTGFEIPPTVSMQPSFRPWQDIPLPILSQAENLAMSHINIQLTRRGHAEVSNLSDIFVAPNILLTTFPELDPFGPRSNVEYIGPLYALPNSPVIDWQEGTRRRIFAYLHPGMAFCEQLLSVLQKLDAEVLCAMPGVPDEWKVRFPRLRIVAHAIDLRRLLPKADVVITYGAGTIATALLAGVPVLLIPQVVEQYLAGLPLEETGAGLMSRDPRSTEQCISLLEELLTKPQYRQAAKAFAKRHAGFSVMEACRRLFEILENNLKLEVVS